MVKLKNIFLRNSVRRARLLLLTLVVGGLAIAVANGAGTALELNVHGLSLYKAGDYAGAVSDFRQALALLPGDGTLTQNLVQALNGWGVRLGTAGEYEEALKRLEEANRLAPKEEAVRANLAVVRINYGTSEMDEKRKHYSEAARLLLDAYQTANPVAIAQIDDRRATLHLLQAREATAQHQTAKAQDHVKKALQIAPTSVPAMLEMADLLYEQGDNQPALDYYLDAQKIEPGVPGLADRIAKIQREQTVESGFDRRATQYFVVSYENGASQNAARAVLDILWDARREIGREFKFYPPDLVPVVIYTQTQYAAATTAPEWSGAIYDGKIRVPIPAAGLNDAARAQLRSTLFHEYTHAVVHELVPGQLIPAWLNEGLACYYEAGRDGRSQRESSDNRRLRALQKQGKLVPVTRLPEVFTAIADKREAEDAYVVSRAFTGWLADHYRASRFPPLLEEIKNGAALKDAFKTVYRKDLKALEEEWLAQLAH